MSNCMFENGMTTSIPATVTSNMPISQHNVGSSNIEPHSFVGSAWWRKNFAQDGPAPRIEEGMVIGRDT